MQRYKHVIVVGIDGAGAFIRDKDANLPPYRDISHLTGAAPRRSNAPHTSELV